MTAAARRRVMVTVAAALFANFLALLGLTPLYADVSRDLGLGPDTFGIYFAIQGAINVTLQLPVGVIADRVGRRPVMTLGLVFMAVGQLLRWRAGDPLVFGVGQVFIGLCSPFVVAAGYAVVADAYQTAGRAQALGTLLVAVNLGQGAGFLLAGILAPSIGWRGYSLCVAALPVLLLPLVATLPEAPRMGQAGSLRLGLLTALRFLVNPAAAALAVVAALNLGVAVGATYLLPFIAHQHHIGEAATGLLLLPYLLGATVGGPLGGRWADRVGTRTPAMISVAVSALAIIAFGAFGFSPISTALCFMLIGAGTGSTLALASVTIVELGNRRGQGTGAALGGMRIGQGLGPAVAPAAAGLVYVHWGTAAAYFALAGAVAIAGGLVYASGALEARAPASEPAA